MEVKDFLGILNYVKTIYASEGTKRNTGKCKLLGHPSTHYLYSVVGTFSFQKLRSIPYFSLLYGNLKLETVKV